MIQRTNFPASSLPIVDATHACPCGGGADLAAETPAFAAALPEGHVLRTFVVEHARLLSSLDGLDAAIAAIQDARDWTEAREEIEKVQKIAEHLVGAESHHQREERVLFVRLGERGVFGPPQALTREHEQLRSLEKTLAGLAAAPDRSSFAAWRNGLRSTAQTLAHALREHIFKENTVLYPFALRVIAEEDVWRTMRAECDAIGYCCFSP